MLWVGRVMMILAESNGSLLLGLFLNFTRELLPTIEFSSKTLWPAPGAKISLLQTVNLFTGYKSSEKWVASKLNIFINKSITYSKLCPQCRILMNLTNTVVVWHRTNATTWWTSSKCNHAWFWPTGPMVWKHNVIKPEVAYIIYSSAVTAGSSHGHRPHV